MEEEPVSPSPLEEEFAKSKPASQYELEGVPSPLEPVLFSDPILLPPENPLPLKMVAAAEPVFQKAYASFSKGDHSAVIRQCEELLREYPFSWEADNCQFLIGEAQFALGYLDQADASYRKVLSQYAHGDSKLGFKTSDAIFMLGVIQEKKNQPLKARQYFLFLLEKYPESWAAKKANQKIPFR